ncbi:hypothetical protein GTY54_51410 [Streptomyces sp. SID625]|nr:hypothetical protein [Streptomyces sp. SID625]
MNIKITVDGTAAARQARFGKLPERISYADMVEETQAGPRSSADDAYDPEVRFNCLATDLGL